MANCVDPAQTAPQEQFDQGLHSLLRHVCQTFRVNTECYHFRFFQVINDDDEFRFNDASTHEGHLRQNGELTWFCNETICVKMVN